ADVEVGDLAFVALAGNKFSNIGMRNLEHGHIRAPTGIVRDKTICQIGVIIFNFDVERQGLASIFHRCDVDKPEIAYRDYMLDKFLLGLAELRIARERSFAI